MADAKAAGNSPARTNTPEYGCVSDLAAQQEATAKKAPTKPEPKPKKEAE